MKFKSEVIIDKPQVELADLWVNPSHFKSHQEGFIRKELISGAAASNGSVSKLYFQHGKHEMELTETIVKNELPNSMEAFYHHKHMDNSLKTSFTKINESQTRYTVEGEYTEVRGIMPKLMMFLFPGMFRKQPKKWMDNFKNFAESM